jgi:hypothetical protein
MATLPEEFPEDIAEIGPREENGRCRDARGGDGTLRGQDENPHAEPDEDQEALRERTLSRDHGALIG